MASKLTASNFIKTNFYILLGEEQMAKDKWNSKDKQKKNNTLIRMKQ